MGLKQVDFMGVDADIRNDLIRMCDLNSDHNLLALKLNELKEAMEKHPWVRSVTMERRLPDTLLIKAEKEEPLALILLEKIYYVNRHGEIFKEVDRTEQIDLPIITGVSKDSEGIGVRLKRATKIMEHLKSERGLWSLSELSEIHLNGSGGISLYFNHLTAEIKLMCEDPTDQIEGLKKVAEHLTRTGRIHHVTAIDLNHVDGALVSFKKG